MALSGPLIAMRRALFVEIDHDGTGLTLHVRYLHPAAIARLNLAQQRQRIMVVDKAHRLAGGERVKRAKNSRVAKKRYGNPAASNG